MDKKMILSASALAMSLALLAIPAALAQEDPGAAAVTINGNHRVVQFDPDTGVVLSQWLVDADRASNVVDVDVVPGVGDVLVTIETRDIVFTTSPQ